MSTIPVSFEFFPPNTPEGLAKLRDTRRQLAALSPEFFSVTYGAGGATRDKTLGVVDEIAAEGHAVAPHLSCVGATRDGVAELLGHWRSRGVRRLVALHRPRDPRRRGVGRRGCGPRAGPAASDEGGGGRRA